METVDAATSQSSASPRVPCGPTGRQCGTKEDPTEGTDGSRDQINAAAVRYVKGQASSPKDSVQGRMVTLNRRHAELHKK